jgi:hypothetical protein
LLSKRIDSVLKLVDLCSEEEDKTPSSSRQTMPEFLYELFVKLYGVRKAAEMVSCPESFELTIGGCSTSQTS